MLLNLEYHLQIVQEIKKINGMNSLPERVEKSIELKDRVRAELNDELDEIFSLVELKDAPEMKPKGETPREILSKVVLNGEAHQSEMEYEKTMKVINDELDKLHWYEKELFILYVSTGSSYAVQRVTKIPRQSVMVTVNKVITHIKEKVKRA